jgi:peptidoglycan hydrolase-like protein with peptidoglycan-binding domain
MGVVAARLVFLAFLGLAGSITYNALYLQNPPAGGIGVAEGQDVPVQTSAARVEAAKLPPVSTNLPPMEVEEGSPQLVVRAVQRELKARGFDVGAEDGRLSNKTKAAIAAYQKNHGLPVTGAATDQLLRHILLGDSAQPSAATGSVKESAGASKEESKVRAVQKVLADLGYAPGPADGALGEGTKRAILAFQKDRKIAATGRITPELLTELKRVTGRDVTKTAAKP